MLNEAVKFKLSMESLKGVGGHPYWKTSLHRVYGVLEMEINPHLKKFLTKRRSTLLQKVKTISNT